MSAEDDEFYERLRQAESHLLRRATEALEGSLANTHTPQAACPSPLDWHPAYADKTGLVDWLNGVGPGGDGKPFVYIWFAAVDELGRAIAGESTIQYLPS